MHAFKTAILCSFAQPPSPVEGTKQYIRNDRLASCFICGSLYSGWGTDEQAVIGILAHRDATQREQIALEYEHKYGESLIQRLQSELTGDFEVPITVLSSSGIISFFFDIA